MQIIKVDIHNFCSIHDGSIELQDYNLLLGANNSGKTNTINALRVFFGVLQYNQQQHRPAVGSTDGECWIEVTFKLTDEEYQELDSAYRLPNHTVRVRRILSSNTNGVKTGLFGYEGDNLSKKPYKLPTVRIVYIPAVSKAEDQTKTTGPSPFRDLINDILGTLTGSSSAYKQLEEDFNKFTSNIKAEKTGDDRSLQYLEQEITQSLESWGIRFSINIGSITIEDIVKNLVSIRLHDQTVGEDQRIEQFGQGLQRAIIYQLIEIKSRYLEEVGDNSTDLNLLLFEEPEAFLHPNQQLELAERLRSISRDDGSQVILSTHSPYFVSQESDNLTSLVRLHRNGGRTVFGQISPPKLQSILTDNQLITPILQASLHTKNHPHLDDQTLDMEAIKYFMWLDPNRCGMFFASQVLLVEGATEAIFINYLIKRGNIKARHGTFIVDCMGKFNIHRFMQILKELKVYHSVLFDDDNGSDIHPQIEQHIRGLANTFTRKIDIIQGCIEDALGIQGNTSSHRKPQHLLYSHHKGKIDSALLAAFIQKVELLVN